MLNWSSLKWATQIFICQILLCILVTSSQLSASGFEITKQNIVTSDTLTIDEQLEIPEMYLYHILEDGKPVFQRFGGGKHQALKWIKNKLPFSGILVLVNDSGKQVCPYINGIPDGLWIKYASDGNIEYEIPVKKGFYHGHCKIYETASPGQMWRTGTFTDGYPDGEFIIYSRYVNTEEIYEAERLTLRTIFNNPTLANRPYLDSDSDQRASVQGIYASQFYPANYLPPLEPVSGDYWNNIIGCSNHALNPLPSAQTILDGEYVKMDIFIEDNNSDSVSISPVKIANKAFWKKGLCLWFEEFGMTPYKSNTGLPNHILSRKSEYEYFSGYFLETRTTLNISNTYFSADNIYQGSISAQELTFFDTLITTTEIYVNGKLKHGRVSEFVTENSTSVSGPESKFSVNYNYAEGEYFLNTKVGEWRYYIAAFGEKKLVCVTNYQKVNNPGYSRFALKLPFKGFCNSSYYGEEAVKNGTEKFYRLKDGRFYVGYVYKSGSAMSIIKE